MGLPHMNGCAVLESDPEVRISPNSGRKTVLLDLAFTSMKRDRRTDKMVPGDFFRITGSVFGTDAEDATELRAGDEVVVGGRLKTDTWTHPETKAVTYTPVLFVDTLGLTVKAWAAPDEKVVAGA